jgi:integrase
LFTAQRYPYRLPELQERIDTYNGRVLTRLTAMLSLHVFVRSSELRFARWNEFDLKRGTWEIPDTVPRWRRTLFHKGYEDGRGYPSCTLIAASRGPA